MSSSPTLHGFQRRYLRGLAHPLKPVVQVGGDEISDAIVAAVEDALGHHELVKVRLYSPEDKKATAAILAERSGAALCGVVGHTVILYKPHPEAPTIELPTRG